MSKALDARVATTGTRFRLFPQSRQLSAFREPETVCVSVPPDEIQPGPADARMFVVDAIGKRPYQPGELPPFSGESNPPLEPGTDGHFDHLQPETREFSAATMYATVRRVLDIWEDYFGRQIDWFFRMDFERLELIPRVAWPNAQSGYGFLEFGFPRNRFGGLDTANPYCENFDVLAHELGHSLIRATVGVPRFTFTRTTEYGGFHESSGDLAAIVASLHFESVVEHLLGESKGNLFTVNVLERVGELSESQQIRMAFNNERMSTVGSEAHDLSQPLTGAIFDVFVEAFQRLLVQRNLISTSLADRSVHDPTMLSDEGTIQAEFTEAYEGKEAEFKDALLDARDYLGRLLATTWDSLQADFLTYIDVANGVLDADQEVANGDHQMVIRKSFAWREITPAFNAIASATHRVFETESRAPVPGGKVQAEFFVPRG